MTKRTPALVQPKELNTLAQRCALWVVFAVMGNLAVLSIPFTLSIAGLEPVAARVFDATLSFALPAYSPTLLFFIVILTILEKSDRTGSEATSDETHATRLIANSIRFTLMIVLSFAATVAIARPAELALVLFAALVGFVSIVRAEVMAPPRQNDSEEIYLRARKNLIQAERSALRALGPSWWRSDIAKRSVPVLLVFFGAPIVIPATVVVVTASVIWGVDDALTTNFLTMTLILMVGPAMLVMAWLSSVDKSETRRSRGWRMAFLIFISAVGIIPMATLFLVSGPKWTWVGWIIIADAVIVALCLWTPLVPGLSPVRRRLERRWTLNRLEKLSASATAAKDRWEAERVPPPRSVRVLTRLIRPFSIAYRLARPAE